MVNSATATAVPAPNSPEEFELLMQIVREVKNFSTKTDAEQNSLLKTLEAYECLMQVVKLLRWRISQKKYSNEQHFYDYLWLLRIFYFGLEDFDNYVETALACVEQLQIPFAYFRTHISENILGVDNYHEQVKLYAKAIPYFRNKTEKILLLERLALLYEKKLFLEADVDSAFSRLLQLDPTNAKALRFYKFYYIQTGQWRDAAKTLEQIISIAANPYEKQRAAHELAQIHLYNLNEPKRARALLAEYCTNSPLDINLTLTEALERLEEYGELINVLLQIEKNTTDKQEKVPIWQRLAIVNLKAAKYQDAEHAAKECIKLDYRCLLAHEVLISSLIELQKTAEIKEELLSLREILELSTSKNEIQKMIDRVQKLL